MRIQNGGHPKVYFTGGKLRHFAVNKRIPHQSDVHHLITGSVHKPMWTPITWEVTRMTVAVTHTHSNVACTLVRTEKVKIIPITCPLSADQDHAPRTSVLLMCNCKFKLAKVHVEAKIYGCRKLSQCRFSVHCSRLDFRDMNLFRCYAIIGYNFRSMSSLNLLTR